MALAPKRLDKDLPILLPSSFYFRVKEEVLGHGVGGRWRFRNEEDPGFGFSKWLLSVPHSFETILETEI